MLRLEMRRGSWIFDETKSLGSNIHFATMMQKPQAAEALLALVVEALEPISEEITIVDIEVRETRDPLALELIVEYSRVIPPEQTNTPLLENQFLTVTVPISA